MVNETNAGDTLVQHAAPRSSNNNNNNHDEDELDVDAEERLRNFTVGLKQQADQLMLAERYKDALPLYKDLLMHLTKSQVNVSVSEVPLACTCSLCCLATVYILTSSTGVCVCNSFCARKTSWSPAA